MYGWRSRIGLIVPSSNTVNESEWCEHLPSGVSMHTSRVANEGADLDSLDSMGDGYKRGAELLATADVDVITYGCTTGSLFRGSGFDEEIEEVIRDIAGVPGVSASMSIRRAFDALDVQSLAVATPYIQEMMDAEVEYLTEHDYEIVDITGSNMENPTNIGRQHPETVYRQVTEDLDREGADGVFISCTDYRTFGVIGALEDDVGIPVVSSNSATLWDTLRHAGVDYRSIELGELFDK